MAKPKDPFEDVPEVRSASAVANAIVFAARRLVEAIDPTAPPPGAAPAFASQEGKPETPSKGKGVKRSAAREAAIRERPEGVIVSAIAFATRLAEQALRPRGEAEPIARREPGASRAGTKVVLPCASGPHKVELDEPVEAQGWAIDVWDNEAAATAREAENDAEAKAKAKALDLLGAALAAFPDCKRPCQPKKDFHLTIARPGAVYDTSDMGFGVVYYASAAATGHSELRLIVKPSG